jgi:tetratricopeptide (TPR) repeat protein
MILRLLLVSTLCLIKFLAISQVKNPEFNNVAKKFEQAKYESVLEMAEALMDNDNHRKKPEPYLWASMCYYEISKSDDEKLLDRWKNPMRNALKYAGKAVAKDKNGNIVENNAEYFALMKEAGISEALEWEKEENYRKSSYAYKQILKFAPEDAIVQFAKGVTDIRLNAFFDAEREIREAFPLIEESFRNLDYEPDPISSPLLKPNVLYYIDHLVENSYADSARKVTMAARVFFPLDEEIKSRLESLD